MWCIIWIRRWCLLEPASLLWYMALALSPFGVKWYVKTSLIRAFIQNDKETFLLSIPYFCPFCQSIWLWNSVFFFVKYTRGHTRKCLVIDLLFQIQGAKCQRHDLVTPDSIGYKYLWFALLRYMRCAFAWGLAWQKICFVRTTDHKKFLVFCVLPAGRFSHKKFSE